MTKDQQNVTPNDGEGSIQASSDAQLDFGAMIRNASPTLRRFVIYQAIILVVLVMVIVGTVAFRASVSLMTSDEETAAVDASGANPAITEAVTLPAADTASESAAVAGVPNIRPVGAVLIRVEREGSVIIFHFRANGVDYIRILDEETGVVKAYEIP